MPRVIDDIIVEIKEKYNKELLKKDPIDIEHTFKLIENCRQKVAKSEYVKIPDEIENVDESVKEIFDLLENFKQNIKKAFIDNKQNLTHITDKSPEEIVGGKLNVSKCRDNHYQTERGDWFFASSSPINGNNLYLARNVKDGMIVRKNVCIYGSDIFKIGYDENGNKRLHLKESNYIYEINPEKFKPVVMLIKGKNDTPYFHFSEEWCSEESIDINDKEQVKSIKKVEDVTPILSNYQIFTDINKTHEGMKIIKCNTKQEMWNTFFESLRSGRLRYINAMMNINVNKEIMENIQQAQEQK